MKKNNTKSVADTKKAFQNALMKKAATKVASCSATSENNAAIEAAPSEVVTSPKTNAESFKKALDLLLSAHPADGRNKRADFSTVLSLLLKMNVDTKSAKEISSETEKSLNILGFTATKAEGKESICKDEIPELVMYLFNGYQKEHPQFCAIDADILHNCPNELDSISKKIWHPIVRYIACQTASYMTEEDAEHLLSGKPAEISDVLKNVKCADQTRAVLVTIAPELGKLIRTLKASSPIPESFTVETVLLQDSIRMTSPNMRNSPRPPRPKPVKKSLPLLTLLLKSLPPKRSLWKRNPPLRQTPPRKKIPPASLPNRKITLLHSSALLRC